MPSRSILRAVTGPTPWKRATGSEATKSAPLLRRDHAQPVGLAMIGGELGDELAVGDAGRGGELALLANAAADVLGDRARAAEPAAVLGDVEIGFVEAQRFDQVGVIGEDRADLLADGAIDVEARLDEDQARGSSRFAVTDGIAERTPNGRAS